jgi:hypothetical protein
LLVARSTSKGKHLSWHGLPASLRDREHIVYVSAAEQLDISATTTLNSHLRALKITQPKRR